MAQNTPTATEKQVDFILKLLSERELLQWSADDPSLTASALPLWSRKDASELIDDLLKMPKKPEPMAEVSGVSTPAATAQALLDSFPKGKYAVPTDLLDITLEQNLHGDLLFVELKEWNNVRYLRKLLGSLGGFTRVKMSPSDNRRIAEVIAADPYKYAKLFGERYSCCGSCGADLTDEKSRALMLGPECRKKFGL